MPQWPSIGREGGFSLLARVCVYVCARMCVRACVSVVGSVSSLVPLTCALRLVQLRDPTRGYSGLCGRPHGVVLILATHADNPSLVIWFATIGMDGRDCRCVGNVFGRLALASL